MSATKRISTGNYDINTFPTTINPYGNVTMTTNTLYVAGNLVVTGNNQAITSFDSNKSTFVLSANVRSYEAPIPGASGMIINRGNVANVALYWNESGTSFNGLWTLTNAAGTQGSILTSYDVRIQKTSSSPVGVTGYVIVTGNTAGVGQSGIYANAGNTAAELATTTSAKKYAIIFG